ncbi:coiled-coil domain-containing protein [Paenibacillus sp. strain BS8-2]
MPAISKIRFTHVLYEGGNKRYNDETFLFDGHNGAIVLENGGGKTVFIQTALQAMLPHSDLSGRKLKDTLLLENGPAHIAIEWILHEKPRRRYAVTCVSLFLDGNSIDSYRYAYEYGEHDVHGLDYIPFVKEYMNKTRPADKGEIHEYYSSMMQRFPLTARVFDTIKSYKAYLEENFHIIAQEWESIVKINDTEGGIEKFFDECKTTTQLFDKLLIPTVEQAMEGFEQDSFANMFESHREGFKRYKELKEQIEENRLILQELDKYVLIYEKLHKAEEQYNAARSEAKAYRSLSLLQHQQQKLEQDTLAERYREWAGQNEQWLRAQQSLEVAETELEHSILKTKLQKLQEEADDLNDRLSQTLRSYYSLQYSELREKHGLAHAKLQQLTQQLARLEQSEEEEQLQERWETNGGQLRTVFAHHEQQIEAELREQAADREALKNELRDTEATMERLRSDMRNWELTLQSNQTMLDTKKEQQQKIAKGILANPSLERVEDQIPIWAARQQQLEEQRITCLRAIKQLSDERDETVNKQKELTTNIREVERTKTTKEQKQEQLKEEHAVILLELAALRTSWERLTSVYEKESSITSQLQEGVAKRRDQKQSLLQRERYAYRYVDDYNEQDLFFADPMVERKLKAWGRQFSLLQTGIEYISGLELVERDRTDDMLWAVTLVTTDSEKLALENKLESANRDFAYPIRVLSASEAAVIVQDSRAGERGHWVVPAHWQDNSEQELFGQWKDGLFQQAELVRGEREQKEEDLRLWENAERRLNDFVTKYPLSVFQSMEKQLHESREQLIRLTQEQKQQEQRLNHLDESLDKHRADTSEMQDLIHQLGVWLKDGQQYMLLGSEIKALDKELVPVKEQIAGLYQQLGMKDYSLRRAKEELGAKDEMYNDSNMKLKLLRSQDLYQESQTFAYVAADRSLVELKEEHKTLERERDGIMKVRKELELELQHQREKTMEAEVGMNQLLREHPELDVMASLPGDIDAQKQHWWSRSEHYREEASQAVEQLSKQRDKLLKIEGVISKQYQVYFEQFNGEQPIRFEEALSEVKISLQMRAQQLEQEKKEWQQRSDYVERQLRDLDHVLKLWDKYVLLHRLDDNRLRPAHIDELRLMDFAYTRTAISEQAIAGLKSSVQLVEKEQGQVRVGMTRFKDYCISHVNDVKLRQMAIQGVELKNSYAEMREFQQAMELRIQRAIHIMMETIQTYDRDLQEFIHRIHMHLKQIVQELRELPKKTRIRTADGWREIYSFLIPEWDDQDGKDRIRDHIEWILGQLERGQFFDEQGMELHNDVRKSLEKWLDSKQLMQVVLKSESMKATCRKVMNDHQITKAAYSWEQSNRWSGGEKWSKNMTLFLGLLNYVAERKRYIKSNMKLHRTVILDNPFGKASSDHVLSPVFFIAEQLGFQMIALTAHAEGKFLQDYFPIVYSCRLRQTSDSSKQIVESTKRIQHAYFKDNAPETLERIDSRVAQITLF